MSLHNRNLWVVEWHFTAMIVVIKNLFIVFKQFNA